MPNFTTLAPIILFLPVMILALVAALAGAIHVIISWRGRFGINRVTPVISLARAGAQSRARPRRAAAIISLPAGRPMRVASRS